MAARTELPHPLTGDLDRAGPAEIVELLARIDGEAFAGVLDPAVLDAAAGIVEEWRAAPPDRLVLAGAGTSGRLAWLLAREHSAVAALPWIAGGPRAFLVPVEGAEDDVRSAREGIGRLLTPRSFFFGITCGLSAPCVAGGLQAAAAARCRSAVFGTNSVALARDEALPDLPGGFRGELEAALASGCCTALTPDVGPEALTGSSRMKGGTATWLLLDAMLAALTEPGPARTWMEERLRVAAQRAAATDPSGRVRALERAASALRSGGRVVYVGAGDAGLAGVLDASECRPTFGAAPDAVRGFVQGGWSELPLTAPEVRSLEELLPLSLAHFERSVRPALRDHDVVLAIGDGPTADVGVRDLLSAKLALNAISTGAFVRAGKVWGNRMIDLAVSNTKLFHRACRIVGDLAGVAADEARRSVVAAIHGVDAPSDELLGAPAAQHVAAACPGVVPLSLLHARGMTLGAARDRLAAEPVVREALRGE